MKLKTLLYISIFAMVPALMSVLMVTMFALEWIVIGSGTLANIFLTGDFARTFTFCLFGSGLISLSIILATQLGIIRYTDKIDNLDEATYQYYEAKRKYEEATFKLVRDIK